MADGAGDSATGLTLRWDIAVGADLPRIYAIGKRSSVRCKRWWSSLIAGGHQIQWEQTENDGMKVFASRSSVGVMKMEESRSVTQK